MSEDTADSTVWRPFSRPPHGYLWTMTPGLYPESCLTRVDFPEHAAIERSGTTLNASEVSVGEHLCWDHYSKDYDWPMCRKTTTYDTLGLVRLTIGETIKEDTPFVYQTIDAALAEQNRHFGKRDRKRMQQPSAKDLQFLNGNK